MYQKLNIPALGIIDFERATKISGSRFAILMGAGAQLERALIERNEALETADKLNLPVIRIDTDELRNEAFAANTPDRCFHCKNELFGKLIGGRRDAHHHVVVEVVKAVLGDLD